MMLTDVDQKGSQFGQQIDFKSVDRLGLICTFKK